MLMFALSLLLASGVDVQEPHVRQTCNVRDFGAVGDGNTLSTGSLNMAINTCAENGGGTVDVPAGRWLTGTIYLKSHVALRLEPGAVLLGSPNLQDYPTLPHASEERNTSLIVADHVEDVTILGEGTIDGNAQAFLASTPPGPATFPGIEHTRNPEGMRKLLLADAEGSLPLKERPGVLLLALHSRGITLQGFRARNAPNWGIKLMCSDDIRVFGLDVRNAMDIANTDALDISNSSNAVVENSYLEAGDDALVVGGPCADGWCPERKTQRVTVNNVILRSRSAALRIGPNAAGAQDFTFNNVVIHDSNRGVMIQARDAETIENLTFSNLIVTTRFVASPGWWGKGEPVSITVAKWAYGSWNLPSTGVATPGVGLIQHVRFTNVIAKGASPFLVYSTVPGRIRDVEVSGLSLTMQSDPLTPELGGNLDLTPVTPYSAGFFRQDLAAIMLHNVQDVSFAQSRVYWQGAFPSYYGSAIKADGYSHLRLYDFSGKPNVVSAPAILLQHGTDAMNDGEVLHPLHTR